MFSSIFSAYLTIFCSLCTIILYMAKFAIVGRMHQLCKTFFSSYSDLYYKTKSLGNLISVIPISLLSLSLDLLSTYNYYIWAEFAMCRGCIGRVCYGPSLLCAELTRHRINHKATQNEKSVIHPVFQIPHSD